jgi:CRP-like cAMP-binding protein
MFRGVSTPELARTARLWQPIGLEPGETVWTEGEAVTDLALLVVGELDVLVAGAQVARVRAPEIIGEASAFFTGVTRTATLRARTPTQLLSLPVPALRRLRWERSATYGVLLEQALLAMCRRVSATNAKIAQVAKGGAAAPVRTEPGVLARLWRSLRPGGPASPCPNLEPLLRNQPGLRDLADEELAPILAGFAPRAMAEGEILCLEGEEGAAMFLVAQGNVDVLRNVRGDRAELLTSLGPGQHFGGNTLVVRGPRTASCVAAGAGWLYRMDADAFGGLTGVPRTVWRECLLTTLASQIRSANAALVRASAPQAATPAAPADFNSLLKASGYLEGLPIAEADLARVSVVVDEDRRRNPRGRTRG